MSEPERPRVEPTHAFVRDVVVVLVGALAGVLLHRLDVVVLVCPFVVHLAWAMLTRHRLVGAEAQLTPASARMREGEAATLRIEASDDLVVSAVLDPPEQARLDPPHGAFIGTGDAGNTIVFEPMLWGRYELRRARVALSDAAGAWRVVITTNESQIMVRPQAASLVGGSGVARPIGIAGVHRSARRGPGTELADVREFVPGDRLRRVNWKVSSRTGRLHVTETFVERDTDVLIVTDTLADIGGATETEASSLDNTVRAVAAISQHYVGFGDRVALHDLGPRIDSLRAGTGPRQARVLLDRLAQARRMLPASTGVRPVRRLTAGTLVFFCSPLLEDAALAELVRLRRLGAELVVVDTLPHGLGRQALPGRDTEWLAEGWTMRRLERQFTVEQLRALGVPVTPWRGPASLGSVLFAMEAARSAPRSRRAAGRPS